MSAQILHEFIIEKKIVDSFLGQIERSELSGRLDGTVEGGLGHGGHLGGQHGDEPGHVLGQHLVQLGHLPLVHRAEF